VSKIAAAAAERFGTSHMQGLKGWCQIIHLAPGDRHDAQEPKASWATYTN